MLAKLLGRCGGRRRHGIAADVLGHVVDDTGDVVPIGTPVYDLGGHGALGEDGHLHLLGADGGDGDGDILAPGGKGDVGGEVKGNLIGRGCIGGKGEIGAARKGGVADQRIYLRQRGLDDKRSVVAGGHSFAHSLLKIANNYLQFV